MCVTQSGDIIRIPNPYRVFPTTFNGDGMLSDRYAYRTSKSIKWSQVNHVDNYLHIDIIFDRFHLKEGHVDNNSTSLTAHYTVEL